MVNKAGVVDAGWAEETKAGNDDKWEKDTGNGGVVEVDMLSCLIVWESYFVQKLLEVKCVRGIKHDGPFRYNGKINQDSDNLDGRCCNQEKHKKRNKNQVYEHYIDREKGTIDT